MQLVVDTNVLISALLVKSKTYEIIVFGDLELLVPEYSLEEIEKHKDELCKRMGVSRDEFNLALGLILSHVTVIPRHYYHEFETRAMSISPDHTDFPFFALALAKQIPFWTNETRLKKQNAVAVYNTEEILEMTDLL